RQRELAAEAPTFPSAKLAADRLRVGDARTAAKAAGQAAAALRETSGGLAGRQEALMAEILALAGNTHAAAARNAARARALGHEADELAAALAGASDPPDAALFRGAPGPPGGERPSLADAAELVRRAARSLADAADKTDAADVAGADRSRGEAEAALMRAADVRAGAAGGEVGPGRALRAAAVAVRVADPTPDVLRRAAATLATAAREIPVPVP
ncbi:MAG TPA: hypothetical protein VH092_11270, partial [Urbifossiella sp.]|nr:hypothetical protein [Urbifossiella sp.]